MFKKKFIILLIPVIIALSVGQGVFADDIQVEGVKVLGDGTSTQTINGVYDPTSGEIKVTQTEDIQSGISNQLLGGIIDTACAFNNIYCYKDDFNKDGKLDYIQLNKDTGEIKYYEFANSGTQLFSTKYATVDSNLRGTEEVLFSIPSKNIIGVPETDNRVIMATKKGTIYRLTQVDVDSRIVDGFNLGADGNDSGQVGNTSITTVRLGNGKYIFKYTGYHNESRSVSGGDSSIFTIMGDFDGLKQEHRTLNPKYGRYDGRFFYVGDTSINIAYNQPYYYNRISREVIEDGRSGVNIVNQIMLYPNNKIVYIDTSGKYHIQIINGLSTTNKSIYHLITKIDNIDAQYNYYIISVDEGSTYANDTRISSIHTKTILLKTDKNNYFKSYKVFDGINKNLVVTDYSPYTIKIPKVNKVLTDVLLGKSLIIYSYNGNVYKIYFDKNSETLNINKWFSHPSANYTVRISRTYYGNIGTSPFDFFVDLGNDYYFSNGIIYRFSNGDFVVRGYTNITAYDIGKPYYNGRRGQKIWQQRGFIKDISGGGIASIIYQTIPDGDRGNDYIAGDTIRAIEKDGDKIIVLGRKDYKYEHFGESSLNRWYWYNFIASSKHYSYIFDTKSGTLKDSSYSSKNNNYDIYYQQYDGDSERYNSYTYRNDGVAVGLGTSKTYTINGVTFTLY